MAVDAGRGSVRRHAWAGYLIAMSGLALLYVFLRRTPFHSGPVFNLLGLSSVGAILAAILMHRAARLPWALIAGGLTTFVTGDVLAYNYQRFFGKALPYPSVADGFYLVTAPLLIAGLVLLIRRRNPAHDRAALIDALIVSISAGTVSWALLIAPYAHDGTLSLSTKLTSVAYPLSDLAVAACVARLALGQGRRSPALAFLTLGVLCLLGTDSIYGWALLHGGYTTGGLLDGGWIAFYLLTGAAALHPSSVAPCVEPAPDTQFGLTPWRIAWLASCAVVTPIVLIVEGTRSRLPRCRPARCLFCRSISAGLRAAARPGKAPPGRSASSDGPRGSGLGSRGGSDRGRGRRSCLESRPCDARRQRSCHDRRCARLDTRRTRNGGWLRSAVSAPR